MAPTTLPRCPYCGRLKLQDTYAGAGGAGRDKWEAKHIRKGGYVPNLDVMQALLGTPRMTNETACKRSIPPAYTEHLGRQVRDTLDTLDVRP